MKKFLREPLLHFLLLGAVLFGAFAWRNRGAPSESKPLQVRISEGDVKWLEETWAKQWQRDPTREELRGQVTEFLKEELLSREAREIGLDQNDTFVRRRLSQKMEFLVQDTSRLVEPTEDDLRRLYAAHPERFSELARVSFTQLYFSREKRNDAAADARAALALLSRSAAEKASSSPGGESRGEGGLPPNRPLPELGDNLLLDSQFRDVDQQAVAAQFGAKFAGEVFALPPGAWRGPIESGFGLHLVRVYAQTPTRQREFAEVRAQVLDRWRDQQQRDDNQNYFAGLLKKYDVVVDQSVKPLVGVLGKEEVVR